MGGVIGWLVQGYYLLGNNVVCIYNFLWAGPVLGQSSVSFCYNHDNFQF